MRPALPIASLLAGCTLAPGPSPGAPDASRAEVAIAAIDPSACGACHRDHADEHAASAHARAWTSPLFQREWSVRGDPFCVPCHAPRAAAIDDVRDLDPALAARGVDCETCHRDGNAIRAVAVSGRAPHESVIDPTIASTAACARCHQVDFPEIPGQPLQDTVAEWREAGEPGGSCATCHLPARGDRHLHHLPGGHEPGMVARALSIEPRATQEGDRARLVVTLRARETGHAIPTGDVYRRLVVRAGRALLEDAREPLRGPRVELGRHFDGSRGPWTPVRDDRVPAQGAREVVLEVPGTARRLAWSVELWSLPPEAAHAASLPPGLVRRSIAHGEIDVEPERPRASRAR